MLELTLEETTEMVTYEAIAWDNELFQLANFSTILKKQIKRTDIRHVGNLSAAKLLHIPLV